MLNDRLQQQIAFIVEADKLKNILRRTPLIDASRLENSAEHSWHLMLLAMVLHEYQAEKCDLLRVFEMMIVHDLVEIDAGDTFAYDTDGQLTRTDREQEAAKRIFGLLPPDQEARLRGLWEEFEEQKTPDARFANAIDRFQPLLQNAHAGGGSWESYGVRRDQVLRRMAPVESAAPELWSVVLKVVEEFSASGVIRPDAP